MIPLVILNYASVVCIIISSVALHVVHFYDLRWGPVISSLVSGSDERVSFSDSNEW